MLLVPRYDMSEGTNTQRDGLSQHKGTYTVKWEAICSLKQVVPEGQSVKTNTLQEEQGIFGELSKQEIIRAITLDSVQAEAGIDCFPVDSQIAVNT